MGQPLATYAAPSQRIVALSTLTLVVLDPQLLRGARPPTPGPASQEAETRDGPRQMGGATVAG
jgi:hypothetical protein